MAVANLAPNERYCIIGKTRSGKTLLAIVIAAHFAMQLHTPWEVWWIDTKNDPKDTRTLRSWGFCNGASERDIKRPGAMRNALYFKIKPVDGYSVIDLAQAKIMEAYNRGHVLLVIDEYTQVCPTEKSEGYGLQEAFARGGGMNVGIIGLTQEPVNIPRKLKSQASHMVLFTLTYDLDIKNVKNYCKVYVPPIEQGYPHGFYWSHIDGTAQWAFYTNQAEWAKTLRFALPKQPKIRS